MTNAAISSASLSRVFTDTAPPQVPAEATATAGRTGAYGNGTAAGTAPTKDTATHRALPHPLRGIAP